MSERKSIFADDWRDCLREHYKDVVQRNDKHTEDTLVPIMHDVGFGEDQLREIKLHATMRTEDLQGDFVPDLELGDDHAHPHDHTHHHDHAHPHDHTHPHDHAHHHDDEPTVYAGVDVPSAEAEVEPLVADEMIEAANVLEEEPPIVEMTTNEPESEQDAASDEPDPNAPQQMSLF